MGKKILVLGATGMAGHIVYRHLDSLEKYTLSNACFRNKLDSRSVLLDIHDESALKNLLSNTKPDIVVNCIGVLIGGSRKSVENCVYVNSYFPHMLSRLAHENGRNVKVIHISTDCVFSGKHGSYSDADEKDAHDVYGMTKNLGELLNDTDLTIRTSIIGPELKPDGEGLFHWVYQQRDKKTIDGYTKSIWGGVTTLELAKFIAYCVDTPITRLFQLGNGEKISKFELLEKINVTFNLRLRINKVDGKSVDKSLIPTKYESVKYIVPSYDRMLEELRAYIENNATEYTFYLGRKNA